jgi:hypothetical protein
MSLARVIRAIVIRGGQTLIDVTLELGDRVTPGAIALAESQPFD